MTHSFNIFLVDDHPVVRNGLKALIERLGNYKISREFNDGEELLDALQDGHVPDLIIMDLMMPVMDGYQAMVAIKSKNIRVPVLMLTMESDEQTIIQLFRLGIRGYLSKSSSADVLRAAISDVLSSGYYHNEMMAKALLEQHDVKDERQVVLEQITERELQFLRLVCDELEPTYEQIAQKMEVSKRTVDGYREAIFRKFNNKSKTGLVLFAI